MATPPPDDPESWTDQDWLEWLDEVDAEAPPLPTGHPRRRGNSMPSQLLGAAMLGLHRAIYGPDADPEIVMVIESDGDPEPDELEIRLDPEDPDASTVTVRPWLHDDRASGRDDGHDG